MGCVVTFHHRISQDRLTAAMEPQTSEAFHALLESALAETAEAAMGSRDVEIELTLRNLTQIKEAFVQQLLGMYHTRIQYPDNVVPLEQQREA